LAEGGGGEQKESSGITLVGSFSITKGGEGVSAPARGGEGERKEKGTRILEKGSRLTTASEGERETRRRWAAESSRQRRGVPCGISQKNQPS